MEKIQKILVVSYSQSGQLTEITDNFIRPLHNVDIDSISYSPKVPYPFPWTSGVFFDAMPESVLETPVELNPITYKHTKYDLIVFAYQPWYLSPSIPASSLLQDEAFLSRVHNTPVITLIGSRNMWLNSQESIKNRISKAGGSIAANIPFVDRTQNQLSAITILHWALTGKKTRKYNILPKPGVSDGDISFATEYGKILNEAIQKNDLSNLQSDFLNKGRIKLSTEIIFIEERAKRLFRIWTGLVIKLGTSPAKRRWMLLAFKYYLVVALFVVAPIVVSLYQIIVAPFFYKTIVKKKQLYLRQIDVKCPYL